MDEQQEQEVIENLLSEAEADGKAKNPGFFTRHLSYEHGGRKRLIFDAIVGGIVPIGLLLADPVVFRTGDPCRGLGFSLVSYSIFAYLATGMGLIAFWIWMIFRSRIKGILAVVFAGIFGIGAVFAGLVGVAMLPYTLPGLIVVIGVLGLLPFLIARIYYHHARFALAQAPDTRLVLIVVLMLVGAVVVTGPPALAQVQFSQRIDDTLERVLADASKDGLENAIDQLRQVNRRCFGACTEMIEQAVQDAFHRDQGRVDDLTYLYQQVSGQSVYLYDCSTV